MIDTSLRGGGNAPSLNPVYSRSVGFAVYDVAINIEATVVQQVAFVLVAIDGEDEVVGVAGEIAVILAPVVFLGAQFFSLAAGDARVAVFLGELDLFGGLRPEEVVDVAEVAVPNIKFLSHDVLHFRFSFRFLIPPSVVGGTHRA